MTPLHPLHESPTAPAVPSEQAGAADWHAANQRYLRAALDLVAVYLTRPAHAADRERAIDQAQRQLQLAAVALPAAAALDTLCAGFGLSPFERDLLLLCAGPELDASFGPLLAEAGGDPARPQPTFSLALAALPDAHWSALAPEAPLRRWRLVEVAAGPALVTSPLRLDERVLHYLLGVNYLDNRLAGIVEPVRAAGPLAPSHQALAGRMAGLWAQPLAAGPLPVVQLRGPESADRREIAAAACRSLGWELFALAAADLPADPRELEALMRLWEREAILARAALLLDCDELDAADPARQRAAIRLARVLDGPLILAGREPRPLAGRPSVSLEVARPAFQERRLLWQQALGGRAASMDGQIEALAAQFSLGAAAIRDAAVEAAGALPEGHAGSEGERLWQACRSRSRPRLDELAQRIHSPATWDDLVLPPAQLQTLRDLAGQVRQRTKVYEQWGFAAHSSRGLGISALFAGASGTGKTLAAEVIANELQLDLYRIDLSQVVSKYIGETEKNLRRVFDAAEDGGAVLLFDEADALFGKRSEVKDSHDRYANIEISYLLQRMEAYRGLAILTTNMKDALDTAFLRRIRFVVHFPFPDAGQRAEIWRRMFPPATPTEGLDIGRLARLNIAGGNIRNIALNAAFLAADAGEPVRMAHLLRAAQLEYAKLERTLTAGEVGDWG